MVNTPVSNVDSFHTDTSLVEDVLVIISGDVGCRYLCSNWFIVGQTTTRQGQDMFFLTRDQLVDNGKTFFVKRSARINKKRIIETERAL